MQRYFFDVFDGRQLIKDVEGQAIPGAVILLRDAIKVARELVTSTLGRGEHLDGRQLRVRDAFGLNVLTLTLRDMVIREGGQGGLRNDHFQLSIFPCLECLKLEG